MKKRKFYWEDQGQKVKENGEVYEFEFIAPTGRYVYFRNM